MEIACGQEDIYRFQIHKLKASLDKFQIFFNVNSICNSMLKRLLFY